MSLRGIEIRSKQQISGKFGGSPTTALGSKDPTSIAAVTPKTPSSEEQASGQTFKQQKQIDDDNEEEEEDNEEEEASPLDEFINDLLDKSSEGIISVEDFSIYMTYIEMKMKEQVPEKWIVNMVTNPKGLDMIKKLAMFQRSNIIKQSTLENKLDESSKVQVKEATSITMTGFAKEQSPTSMTAPNVPPAGGNVLQVQREEEWLRFGDEYEKDKNLNDFERQIWKSQMKVKIEVLNNLSKDITAKTNSKTYSKFKTTDCYGKWARDLKNELLPIPLCGRRLELGHLVNPRTRPDPNDALFKQEDQKFDVDGFQSALLLFELLDDVKKKVCDFMYMALTHCMTENLDAQEVIRSVKDKDFYTLFQQLTIRFEKNKQVQKEELLLEFKNKRFEEGRGEALRDYFGRLNTIVTELRTVYNRDVPDEDLKNKFMEALSETSKNNLLQLENTVEYRDKLTDLCYEVIKRDERLRASLAPYTHVVNHVSDYRNGKMFFRGICHTCGNRGHKAIDCKFKKKKPEYESKDNKYQHNGSNTKRKFDWSRVKLKSGHKEQKARDRDQDEDEQANLVESEYDKSRVECWLCHERNSHETLECPNVDCRVKFLVDQKEVQARIEKNKEEDEKNPRKKYRIA